MTFTPKKIPLAAAAAIALGAASGQQAMAQSPSLQAGPVTLTFGGFTELATIYRNRLTASDVGSDFGAGGIPTASTTSVAYNSSEFRESARQSRFSLLAQGEPYGGAKAELYMETDFLSAGSTSNSRESNSYTLRMRHFYGRFITDSGLDVTAGQTWSLVTLAKNAGMAPRDQITPATIDAQYVVGFNWTRNPQLRIVKNFSKQFALGLSIESPQVVTSGGSSVSSGGSGYSAAINPVLQGTAPPCGSVSPVEATCGDGAGLMNVVTTYSQDTRPDVVLKVAADPGWGHYELYGLARWFTSNIPGSGTIPATHNTASGGGVGFGMILPLAPNVLSFQLSGLYGRGIGRYGSSQLPDVALKPNGDLSPIKEYQVLGGLTLTPSSSLSIYAYLGREKGSNTNFLSTNIAAGATAPVGYVGYGQGLGSTLQVNEVTVGEWWKFYRGKLGNAQFGLQAAYLQRDTFGPLTGGPGASGNVFIGMASFRYYPYQN